MSPPSSPSGVVDVAQKTLPVRAETAYKLPFFCPTTSVSSPDGVCSDAGTKDGAIPKSASMPGEAGQFNGLITGVAMHAMVHASN